MKLLTACLLVGGLFLSLPSAAQAPAAGVAPAGLPQSKDLFDAIHVVVGPSARSLDPIAVSPGRCPPKSEACAEIDGILEKDFLVSGYFKVLERKSFLANPATETLAVTSWDAWTNVGAKYLVKTEVKAGARGLDIEFRLMDVAGRKVVPVKGQTATGVAKNGVRRATHEFVNGVIEVVTGKRGIFGSEIIVSQKLGTWERVIVGLEMDGSGRRHVIANGSANMFPRFAPGGDILYTSFLPETPQLYVGTRRITNDDRQYRGAEFSPDGKVIVASVDMDGQSDLVLIDPQTGVEKKRLTDTEWDEVSATWSRNGATIAFVSSRSGHPQIYLMSPDGTNERRLTMVGQYNSSPRFGPDNILAFAGMDGYTSDIFTIDTSGAMNRLTQDQGRNKDPAWSRDGRYLVFVSDRTGGWRVWIMTEDGRYQFPITEGAGWYSTPDWGR